MTLRYSLFFSLMLAVLSGLLPVPACAESSLESWRNAVAQAAFLAENNIPEAIRQGERLHAEIPANATASDEARILNVLARANVYYGMAKKAENYAVQAYRIAQSSGDKAGQAESDLSLVLVNVNLGRINEMNESVVRSMTTLEGLGREDLLAEAMLRTSMMYRRMEHLSESVAVAVQLMSIARHSANPLVRTYAYQAMASVNDLGGRPVQGVEYYQKMREEARRANTLRLEAEALLGVAGMYKSLGELDKADAAAREAIETGRRIGANVSANRGLLLLAGILQAQGKYSETNRMLNEAVSRLEVYDVPIGLWWALDTRSKFYRETGNMKMARADVERAYEMARKIGFPLYIGESAARMAELLAVDGDYKRAYRFSAEAAEMKSKLASANAGEHLAQLTTRYERESKQKEIEGLRIANERQMAEIAQRQLHQRWLWTLLAGSALMLSGSAFFLFRLRRSHHRLSSVNKRLRQSQEEIKALNVGLEHAIQERTAELRQQTRYLRTMIDMLPMLTWFKNTESRFLAVNRAFAEAGGDLPENFIGRLDTDYWPEQHANAYRKDDLEVMQSGQSKTIEEQIVMRDSVKWIETYKAPVFDEDGTVLGTVGVARDISTQKATEEARESALAEARRLASMRSQFLAQMSHELRTPLNGILGYAQIMKRAPHLDERLRDGLNVIQESGEHLLTLINDILDFAKIDAGKMEITPGDMALSRFLKTLIGIINIKAEQKHLHFITDIAPDLPLWIRADEKRLRQVLLNLLANAVKFTDKGDVRLSVSQPAPNLLKFEVSDTGIGIQREHVERIFQPFEQMGDIRQRAKGTGLGLPISRELVRLMGGDITVRSQPGQGSCFSFELPVASSDISQAALLLDARVQGYENGRKRILVVDDVAINRAVLLDMLAPLGFEVLEATDGKVALEMIRLHAPDLVLMDIAMPEMNGLEATRAIRATPGLEALPIVAISASASGNDEAASLESGMNAFLPKPVELDRLLSTLAYLLEIIWVYEPDAGIAFDENESSMVPPPDAEMQVLHRLALQGNMRDIIQMAERLALLGAEYKPFAERLIVLAKGYQSKAILGFVESHMSREAES